VQDHAFTLFGEATPSPPRFPDGVRLYAVGDIHGRSDLLDRLHTAIAEDARSAADLDTFVVYLGDYVDRGIDSAGVLERLSQPSATEWTPIFLRGNHDDVMNRCLADTGVGPHWFRLGGLATLASYGVPRASGGTAQERLRRMSEELAAALPAHHAAFLASLRLWWNAGDYLFAHAGVRPGIPMDWQMEHDLLWIRDDFLNNGADLGKIVVHGHSMSEKPVVRVNRIGIDTGACAGGKLTCLALEGAGRRFIDVA